MGKTTLEDFHGRRKQAVQSKVLLLSTLVGSCVISKRSSSEMYRGSGLHEVARQFMCWYR